MVDTWVWLEKIFGTIKRTAASMRPIPGIGLFLVLSLTVADQAAAQSLSSWFSRLGQSIKELQIGAHDPSHLMDHQCRNDCVIHQVTAGCFKCKDDPRLAPTDGPTIVQILGLVLLMVALIAARSRLSIAVALAVVALAWLLASRPGVSKSVLDCHLCVAEAPANQAGLVMMIGSVVVWCARKPQSQKVTESGKCRTPDGGLGSPLS